MAAYVSFFESGRAIVSQENKPMVIFNRVPGLCAQIEDQGFDVEEVQKLMNDAAAKHNGICWYLMPETAA